MGDHSLANRLVIAAGLLLATVSLRSPASGDAYAPRIGQRHQDFTLPAIEGGRPVALSQYRGKKVLLIHFASW